MIDHSLMIFNLSGLELFSNFSRIERQKLIVTSKKPFTGYFHSHFLIMELYLQVYYYSAIILLLYNNETELLPFPIDHFQPVVEIM